MGLLASLSVLLHFRFAVKPAAWATSAAWAAGAACSVVVRIRAAAPATMDAGRQNLGARRFT